MMKDRLITIGAGTLIAGISSGLTMLISAYGYVTPRGMHRQLEKRVDRIEHRIDSKLENIENKIIDIWKFQQDRSDSDTRKGN